jgi:hypothetical protein
MFSTGDDVMLRAIIPALTLLVAATATAEARYACAVKRTPDGFVALREGPSASHKMVARMRPQEMVHIMHPETEDVKRSGDWLWARWFPGTKRTAFHTPTGDERTARTGWVYDRLFNCFEE